MQVGHVRINASREGTWLVLQVDDDGERLPPGWTCDGVGTSGSWRTPDEDSPRCLRRNRPWKHTRDKRTLVRLSLKSLADTLDPDRFVCVHRSTIVNIRHVRAIEQLASGDQRMVLSDGTELRVSRTWCPALEARLGSL